MLERLQPAPLSVGQAHGAGNRHDDALVVGDLGSVRERRREGGQRTLPGLALLVTIDVYGTPSRWIVLAQSW